MTFVWVFGSQIWFNQASILFLHTKEIPFFKSNNVINCWILSILVFLELFLHVFFTIQHKQRKHFTFLIWFDFSNLHQIIQSVFNPFQIFGANYVNLFLSIWLIFFSFYNSNHLFFEAFRFNSRNRSQDSIWPKTNTKKPNLPKLITGALQFWNPPEIVSIHIRFR